MPTDLQQLVTARSQVLALIVDLTENPKPNYMIDGQQVAWGDYMAMLTQSAKDLGDLIAGEGGPFELETRGYPG